MFVHNYAPFLNTPEGYVAYCYNYGTAYADTSYYGGICGYNRGEIYSCY
jgi:hypothetical protein